MFFFPKRWQLWGPPTEFLWAWQNDAIGVTGSQLRKTFKDILRNNRIWVSDQKKAAPTWFFSHNTSSSSVRVSSKSNLFYYPKYRRCGWFWKVNDRFSDNFNHFISSGSQSVLITSPTRKKKSDLTGDLFCSWNLAQDLWFIVMDWEKTQKLEICFLSFNLY